MLSDYFFESPAKLEKNHPEGYRMLRAMYHQDTRGLLAHVAPSVAKRIGRNAPCPCGSGKKFKECCLTAISKT